MIKRELLLIMFCLIILLTGTTAWADEQQTAEQEEAQAVVTRYFDALAQGDTETIKYLLGGKFLQRREKILSNPVYPDLLSELYALAEFEIIRSAPVGNNAIAVDTIITLNPQEIIKTRFLLAKLGHAPEEESRFRIVGENELD